MSATRYHAPIHSKVAALDFDRLRSKLLLAEDGQKVDVERVRAQEHEYRRFLTMHLLHPEAVLVPTKFVDEFWHAHILDTVAYAGDTEFLFGRFLHHFPYFGIRDEDDAVDLKRAFEETCRLYVETLGEPPVGAESSRCGDDHVCHAPSSCACRSPSACR